MPIAPRHRRDLDVDIAQLDRVEQSLKITTSTRDELLSRECFKLRLELVNEINYW